MGKRVALALVCALGPSAAAAQQADCRFICGIELKIEPTFTIGNLANRHRVATPRGDEERVDRERGFETVLAFDMPTTIPRLGFTVEAIAAPFSDDNDVELEFEMNIDVITDALTRGWVTSHFDVVDKFSPAERPGGNRAYTHKLDFELDTAFHPFNRLAESRWLHGVEVEASLDYLATGLPKRGDVFEDGTRFLDHASRWSLSFVLVLPIVPF
jgi:hypothetical protein